MTLSTNRHRILLAALCAAALPAFFALRAGVAAEKGAVNPPSRMQVKNGVVTLTLSAADQQHDGILTARPSAPSMPRTVAGYGTVLDAAGLTALNNRYLDATTQLQTAEAKLAVSRAAFERAKILHGEQQNISTAELQRAQGRFAVDQAGLAAAHARVGMVSATARQDWGNVLGKALVDGAPLVAELIARRQYLVKVILPPGVMLKRPPETATAWANGAAGIRLAFVSPATTTDPRLQGIGYFYSAPADARLLPGMNLRVRLPAAPIAGGLAVPQSAVVWLQGKAWVYLRTGPRTFVRREILPDRPGPNGGYIVTGLPPGHEIVVQGAQMLLSEEFRSQVPIED